jgi:hypothetical protein
MVDMETNEILTHRFIASNIELEEITVIRNVCELDFEVNVVDDYHLLQFLRNNYRTEFFEENILVLLHVSEIDEHLNKKLQFILRTHETIILLLSEKILDDSIAVVKTYLYVVELKKTVSQHNTFRLYKVYTNL